MVPAGATDGAPMVPDGAHDGAPMVPDGPRWSWLVPQHCADGAPMVPHCFHYTKTAYSDTGELPGADNIEIAACSAIFHLE